MTELTKLKARESEIKKELIELRSAEGDEVEGKIEKLLQENKTLQTRMQAELILEEEETKKNPVEDEDAEAKEIRSLRGKVRISRYMNRAAVQKAIDGVEKEFNAALKVDGEGVMPLELLAGDEVEKRADAVTDLSVNVAQRPQPWLTRVFEGTVSSHLGIARRTVSGLAAFPVINSGVTAETVGEGDPKDAEVLGLTVDTLEPRRISARYVFSKEDAARLGPQVFEDSLRSDLRGSLVAQTDDEILHGADDGGTVLIKGILESKTPTLLNGGADAEITGASTGKEIADGIMANLDGRYATMSSDLRYACNARLFAHLKTLGITFGNTDSVPLEVWLRTEGIMGMASAFIDEISGSAGESYVVITKGRGLAGSLVHSVWDSVEIIRDPFRNAERGQVGLTLCLLHNFIVVRSDNVDIRRVARTA